jgi:hypothetical protein
MRSGAVKSRSPRLAPDRLSLRSGRIHLFSTASCARHTPYNFYYPCCLDICRHFRALTCLELYSHVLCSKQRRMRAPTSVFVVISLSGPPITRQ